MTAVRSRQGRSGLRRAFASLALAIGTILVACGGPASNDTGPDASSTSGPEAASGSDSPVPPDGTMSVADASDSAVPDSPDAPMNGRTEASSLPTALSGEVQKGPFVRGSSITVQELDSTLAPTGRTFQVTTNDDEGDFSIPVNVSSQYVEAIAFGYYFDELSNQLSSGQLTLRALADLTGGGTVNVNLLTSMSEPLVKNLMGSGTPFSQATTQAESAVLAALGFSPSSLGGTFSSVALTGAGLPNGEALAASLIVEQYARSLGSSEVAQLSQVLGEIGAATADAGGDAELAALHAALCATIWAINPAAVRSNLTAYYASLGASVTVPPFEQFLCGCGIVCSGADGGMTCVNQMTDPNNCNACGTTCASGVCSSGTCQAACAPGSIQCADNGLQTCGANLMWGGPVDCGNQACVNGACIGVCSPGATQCNGGLETCGSNGQWGSPVPCANGCASGACIPGNDAGEADATLDSGDASDGGSDGAGACALTMCNGACVDTNQDNSNCGGCGTVCSAVSPSAAQCTGGRCLVALASSSVANDICYGLAVDAANVYWTLSSGPVSKIPVGGGVATTLASSVVPAAIVVDATNVYFAGGSTGAILKVPINGGSQTAVVTNTPAGSIAVDTSSVYWTVEGAGYDGGSVMKAPIDGVPDGGSRTTLASNRNSPYRLVIDANNVYWSGFSGEVASVSLDGGDVTLYASRFTEIVGIAVDSTRVYWPDSLQGSVLAAAIDGGTPMGLVSGQNQPYQIAVDALSVYWTDVGAGTINKVPVGGGNITSLAAGQPQAYALAVDSTSVYWCGRGGTVMKVTPK